jgi:hypothetical protein
MRSISVSVYVAVGLGIKRARAACHVGGTGQSVGRRLLSIIAVAEYATFAEREAQMLRLVG